MPPSILERNRFFKKGISPKVSHRSRQETTIQIRKMKKNEQLMKRRRNPTTNNTSSTTGNGKKFKVISIDDKIIHVMTMLPAWMQNRSSITAEGLFDLVQETRRLVTSENPPIGKLLSMGVLPYLNEVVRTETNAAVLYEAIWAFINIASSPDSTHAEAVANSGAVLEIARHLRHESSGVREQAIWFIANIAGESIKYRDALWEMDTVVDGILYNLDHPANVSLLGNCGWAISNLLRGDSKPRSDLAVKFIPGLVDKLAFGIRGRVKAAEIVDLMCALGYMVEISDEANEAVFATNITSTLGKLIEYYSEESYTAGLLCPAVRILGNFAAGTNAQTEAVIKCGFVKHALRLLQPSKRRVLQRETLFCLSNVAAGTKDQINTLVLNRPLLARIVQLAEDSPFDVTKEALWTLTNIILIGDKIQANYTVNHGSIPALCRFIDPPRDTKLVIVVLEAIEKLLAYNRVTNLDYIEIFEQCNGDLKLEEIQKYDNDRTYEMAVHILKTYFEGEEEVSDENLAPNVSECNTAFDFGVGLPSKQLFPETNSGLTAQTMQFDFTMS